MTMTMSHLTPSHSRISDAMIDRFLLSAKSAVMRQIAAEAGTEVIVAGGSYTTYSSKDLFGLPYRAGKTTTVAHVRPDPVEAPRSDVSLKALAAATV